MTNKFVFVIIILGGEIIINSLVNFPSYLKININFKELK